MSAAAARQSPTPAGTEAGLALECGIAAFGIANLDDEKLAVIRKAPQAQMSMPLAPSVARHCDEQTIASLFAVGEALRRMQATASDFKAWGIVASTRYLGRSFFSQSLDKFDREGPWNTSVQVVPHRSLHSPSSTISLALGCHGPNVGVGGAIDGEGQALLTAASMLDEFALPGVWLVLAGWSPELNIDAVGQPTHEARCHALALALKPTSEVPGGLRLRIVPDHDPFDDSAVSYANTRNSSWLSLMTTLLHKEPQNLNVIAPLCDGLRAELVWNSVGAAAAHDAQVPLRATG
ncbi:MAG: hypothetical protein H7062_23040 [Candidatus Saccharimonas sp.]|nr:hypothetical protein [Planctomycetaceae bacterium]